MPIYRVNLLYNMFAQRYMNVMHFDANNALGAGAAVEIADAVVAAFQDSGLDDVLANDLSFAGIELRRVDLADQPAIEAAPTGGAYAMLAAGDPIPPQVALLVSGTALTAFPRRVRSYIPGAPEGQSTNGLFVSTIQNAGVSFMEELDLVAITGASLDRVAVAYGDEGDGPIVTASNSIETYFASPVPATQRRRRVGTGI